MLDFTYACGLLERVAHARLGGEVHDASNVGSEELVGWPRRLRGRAGGSAKPGARSSCARRACLRVRS